MERYISQVTTRIGIIFTVILISILLPLHSASSNSKFTLLISPVNSSGLVYRLTPPEFPASIAKPSEFVTVPPWGSGESHKISNGYKTFIHYPENCQSHTSGNTKDCYALDFGGSFTVRPVADGIVEYAGWASGGYGTYGRIVYICHGTFNTSVGSKEICSFYAHLASIDENVAAGRDVQRGQVIGISGRSGCHIEDHWKDPHLHFSIHAGPVFNVDDSNPPLDCEQSGGTGPHSGYAVVPEPFSDCLKDSSPSCEDLLHDEILARSPRVNVSVALIVDDTGSMQINDPQNRGRYPVK